MRDRHEYRHRKYLFQTQIDMVELEVEVRSSEKVI